MSKAKFNFKNSEEAVLVAKSIWKERPKDGKFSAFRNCCDRNGISVSSVFDLAFGTTRKFIFKFENSEEAIKEIKSLSKERPSLKKNPALFSAFSFRCKTNKLVVSEILDAAFGKKIGMFTFNNFDEAVEEIKNKLTKRPSASSKEYEAVSRRCNSRNIKLKELFNEVFGEREKVFEFTDFDEAVEELKRKFSKRPHFKSLVFRKITTDCKKYGLVVSEVLNSAFGKTKKEFTFNSFDEAVEEAVETWEKRPICSEYRRFYLRSKRKNLMIGEILDKAFKEEKAMIEFKQNKKVLANKLF